MRCQTEAGGVTGLELTLSVFRQFRFQNVVQFLLDRDEVGFAAGLAYLTGQGIEAAGGDVQLVGGFSSRQRVLLEGLENMPDERRAMTME